MTDKLIYNNKLDTYCILDTNNNIVNTTDIIDFSTLPSNIFNNISLYLGNEYKLYNIDYQDIYSLLINDDIYFDKKTNIYYNKDGKSLYNYDLKNEILWLSYDRITSVLESKYGFNWQIIRQLCKGILKEHYKWNVVITNLVFELIEHPIERTL